jgi:hypothetical protein
MAQMYIGQGHDIAWTNHKTIPSEADYLRMVDGSMFDYKNNTHKY